MITGAIPADNKVLISVGATDVTPKLTSAQVVTGGNTMPYRCAPEPGSATVNLFYKSGATIPTLNPGQSLSISVYDGLAFRNVFVGTVADIVRQFRFNETNNTYGTVITIYAYDLIARLNQISVPGVITSAATKFQTWEERLTNTLQPYFPSSTGVFPSTASAAHQYRLVDNNVNGSLYDQVCLACNSVGATWTIDPVNNKANFYARGVYPTSGVLFTDVAGYWTAGNKPANAGTITAYNMTYKTLETSYDTRNLTNSITVRNIMPANIITRTSDGALLYKDPATTKVDALEVIEPTYTGEDATSITNNGRRPSELVTNTYPYRTIDSDSFYVRYNATLDPYCEYQNPSTLTSNVANTTFVSTTVYSGTYSALVTLNSAQSSWAVYAAPAIRFRPYTRTGTINTWRIRMRAPNATTTVFIQAEFQDSSGNILSTYSPAAAVALGNGVWTQLTLALPAASIPAGATFWRPRLSINANPAVAWAAGTAWRFDEIEVNPNLDTSQMFSGDTADTATDLYEWEGYAGESWSYRIRNVLDNIATDALTYLKDSSLAPRYLEWNARQNYEAVRFMFPGYRVDIRFAGTNYASWIDRVQYDITPDNMIVKLDLSPRPSSWT